MPCRAEIKPSEPDLDYTSVGKRLIFLISYLRSPQISGSVFLSEIEFIKYII